MREHPQHERRRKKRLEEDLPALSVAPTLTNCSLGIEELAPMFE